MQCQFIATSYGCRCTACGRQVKGHSGDRLVASCLAPCVHLTPTADVALIECESCQGRVRIKYPANDCAIYGRCLPTFVPADLKAWEARKPESDLYHLCHGCDRFSPA